MIYGCGCDEPAAPDNANCDGTCLEGYVDFGNGCELIIVGCTDEDACNYDATANTDDGYNVIYVDVTNAAPDNANCDGIV